MINFVSSFGSGLEIPVWFGAFMPLIILWSIFWKGLALWHAGRRGQQWWFIAFLFINTVGILEIIYLFGVAKLKVSKLFSK